METILGWVPRVVAATVGLTVMVWGVIASWNMAFGGSGNPIAGLGLLVLVTPVLALSAAAINFWFVDFALAPVRRGVSRRPTP